jgi:hypothetical protein
MRTSEKLEACGSTVGTEVERTLGAPLSLPDKPPLDPKALKLVALIESSSIYLRENRESSRGELSRHTMDPRSTMDDACVPKARIPSTRG